MIVFSFDYPPHDGGISRLCSEVARCLAKRCGNPLVLSERARDGAECVPTSVKEVRVPPRRPWREVQSWWHIVRSRERGTVVAGIWYPEGLIALLGGVRSLVVLAHGLELRADRVRWRRWLRCRLQRLVCESASLVVANSEYTRQITLAEAPHAKVVAVPLAVDHIRFAPGDRSAARNILGLTHEFIIATVSRLNAYKGHDVVLRAMASLPISTLKRFQYIIAGRGPEMETLRGQVDRLGLRGNVRFLGFVGEKDLPDVYRASDLFVMCTRESVVGPEVEGFGLAFLEAQACATPVVGTRTGGICDAVREGEGGWLIEQDDAAALRQILLRLTDNPAEFREAGETARRRVERECTWEQYTNRFLDALRAHGVTIA